MIETTIIASIDYFSITYDREQETPSSVECYIIFKFNCAVFQCLNFFIQPVVTN